MEGKLTREGIYQVWHAVEPTFTVSESVLLFPRGFKRMGNVVAQSLEEVFALTQNCGMGRSTSVGDVVVTPKGERYCVESFGWLPIELAEGHLEAAWLEQIDRSLLDQEKALDAA
jgi:hypothetical protein